MWHRPTDFSIVGDQAALTRTSFTPTHHPLSVWSNLSTRHIIRRHRMAVFTMRCRRARACACVATAIMFRQMLCLRRHHFKILWSVVVAHAVQVMNNFRAGQWAAKFFFDNQQTATDVAGFAGTRMRWQKYRDVAFVLDQSALPSVSLLAGRLQLRAMASHEPFTFRWNLPTSTFTRCAHSII